MQLSSYPACWCSACRDIFLHWTSSLYITSGSSTDDINQMNGSPCKGHAVLPKTLTVNYSSRAKLVSMLGTKKDYQYYTTGNLTEDRAASWGHGSRLATASTQAVSMPLVHVIVNFLCWFLSPIRFVRSHSWWMGWGGVHKKTTKSRTFMSDEHRKCRWCTQKEIPYHIQWAFTLPFFAKIWMDGIVST